MNVSRSRALFVIALAGLLVPSGCGSDARPTDVGVGPSSPVTPQAAATPATGGGATEPDAQPGTVPVEVKLKDGGFSSSTPKTFHVPSGFTIVVSARAADQNSYSLRPVPARGAKTIAVAPGGRATGSLPALKSGESIKLYAGADSSVTISADADPGP